MKVFLCVLVLILSSDGEVFPPTLEQKIRSYIEASMTCHHIPGMTLAVVKGDEVWTEGFGKEDISTGKLVDADSKFGIGSITKAFTATLLGILISEKGLDWTTKVTSILGPGYEFIDPYRTKELTLRDLLSHRTGLARLDFGLLSGFPPNISTSTFCKNLKYLPEEIPVRDGMIYNNYMFMMLGHVTEVLGGDSWENLVTSKLLRPIGMNSTTFIIIPDDTQGPDVARPYIFKDGEFQNGTQIIYDLRPIGSAGAIASSATDMAKWIRFIQNFGVTESGEQLIDMALMKDMRRPTTPVADEPTFIKPTFPVDYITTAYGYAWFISEYRGYKVIQHGGSLFSYISQLVLLPDLEIGIFTSVNGPGYGDYSGNHIAVSMMYLLDHLLKQEPWLNETTACTFPEPWKNKTSTEVNTNAAPVRNYTEYEGFYGNHLFADVEVYVNSSELLLNSNHIHGTLHPYTEKDKFFYQITYPWEFTAHDNTTKPINVTFLRDEKTGAVRALTAKLEVDETYVKGESLFDVETNSASGIMMKNGKNLKDATKIVVAVMFGVLCCVPRLYN